MGVISNSNKIITRRKFTDASLLRNFSSKSQPERVFAGNFLRKMFHGGTMHCLRFDDLLLIKLTSLISFALFSVPT
jgi:hypothetical protein